MASSTASSSLWPPRAKNLMPLSGMGLWDAEITTPRSASREAVKYATPGVGNTPTSSTSTPAEASPAATADDRNCPDTRVSRPMMARGRCPENSPRSARTAAAATARSTASSAVMSPFARPRTPSVPKRRAMRARLTLRVLRSATGLLQTGLLTLNDACVASEEASLLESRAVGLVVDLIEGPSHTQTHCASLPGGAAAGHANVDIELALDVEQRERVVHFLLVKLVGEVCLERAAVDEPLASAGDQAHAGNSLLTAAKASAGGNG